MGGFKLSIHGQPYRPEHKAQDRVLELLKVLTAARVLRRGDAERDWLCETLWPDADVVRARKSLESTVSRLRRLLQDEATVIVSEGRVRLSPLLVWSDVGAIADAWLRLSEAHDAEIQGRTGRTFDVRADVSGLLSLYKGSFLQGEFERPWVLGARAQMARLLRQALLTLGQLNGHTKREFLLLLEQAHVVDPAAEEIAQMLIRHHLSDANHGEALRVYRRTRDTIHALLGTQLSPTTEMLGREVLRAVERDASATSGVRH
jgi:DNA-binding SARP family transcriptional activator